MLSFFLFNIKFHFIKFDYFKAIGARNAAKSMEKQTEAQQMQLQALYNEKLMQLERLEKTLF